MLTVTVAAGLAAASPATADSSGGRDVRITVMETSDLHGNALNWDYFKNWHSPTSSPRPASGSR